MRKLDKYLNRLIIFCIRKRLGLRTYQKFYFKNQANLNDRYYFSKEALYKIVYFCCDGYEKESNLRLNFLLSDEAKKLLIRSKDRWIRKP